METNNEIMLIADKAMPAVFKNAELTYNASKNILHTQGYTSQAGNTYYEGVRFSDRIIITQQIGEGYFYTFLNGLRIFGFNGKEATLIAEKSYHCQIHIDSFIRDESENLVKEYLRGQALLSGGHVEENVLDSFAQSLISDTMKNQLPYMKQLNQ